MTRLAPILQSFFTDKLITQKHASPHTIAAYRDALRLLLTYAQSSTGTPPWRLDLHQLDHELITGFLRYLEIERGNSPRTRNARLATIHSLFRYAALRAPDDSAAIQRVLAIEGGRTATTVICWLSDTEAEAILSACDRSTWIGRRDHALLLVALRTGLRVSELTHLACGDVHLDTGPYLRCTGKGRKDRCTPLDAPTVVVLRQWLAERAGQPGDPVFCTRQGRLLSRDAVQARLDKYHVIAVDQCPSLADKNLSPHTLRHSTATRLRLAGVDLAVIALWLGHDDIKSTQKYLHADLELKERALARTSPPNVPAGGPPGPLQTTRPTPRLPRQPMNRDLCRPRGSPAPRHPADPRQDPA